MRSPVPRSTLDPGVLEVLWARLIATADDQAAVLKTTSFTYIVRDADDLSAATFDREGRMIVQAVTGSPGHINSLAAAIPHFLPLAPDIRPGDVLITNEPWLNSGQLNDFTVVSPIFHHEDLVGYVGSTCHALDIGGRGLTADARDVYEEGIRILPTWLYREGKPNQALVDFISWNVRTPELALGDLHAQIVSNDAAIEGVCSLLCEFGLEDLETVSTEIRRRSENALRDAIAGLPDGDYSSHCIVDGIDDPVELRCTVTVEGRDLRIDYSGSSPQSRHGINVVLNYATAYTTFAVNCALAPGVPHNDGTFQPVTVSAPSGSILNAKFPAPVAARHTVGHFIPGLVLEALSQAKPEMAMAQGSSSLWVTTVRGHDDDAEFVSVLFSSGGMGARPTHDGLNTISFPSGAGTTPVEVLENSCPIMIWRKELRADSGGAGQFRGGLGQTIELGVRSPYHWMLSCLGSRFAHPAAGVHGGMAGAPGRVLVDGQPVRNPRFAFDLEPQQRVVLELPGGGGFGDPAQRSERLSADDRDRGITPVS